MVEWNESEGTVKRSYFGFRKRSLGVVQFDTIRDRFLAAGDEFQIKFWDMDSVNVLSATDADGGLPVSFLCFHEIVSRIHRNAWIFSIFTFLCHLIIFMV